MDTSGPPPDGRGERTSPWRFVPAAWAETTAAFGAGCCGLLGIGAIAGTVYLYVAAGFSGTPRTLTSEFVALHVADAFRWPAYLVVVCCGGQIGHRRAVPESIAVASKVTALCVVVLAALTTFGIAAIGAQVARGVSMSDAVLCAYAICINFGWHVFLLAAVSMAIQVALRDAIRAWPAPAMAGAAKGRWFGTSIAAATTLVWWGLDGGATPLGPAPAPYSGMNGYGHHVRQFCAAGLFWTALTLIVVFAAHAWTCRTGARRRLSRGMVNAGVASAVICIATGCWMYFDMPGTHWNEGESRGLPADNPGWPVGVIHVVALDLEVDIDPAGRRLESRGSMLLANAGAEPIGQLALSFPEGMHVHRIDVPSAVENVAGPGLHRYLFARPLRPGERVRMGFELAWQRRGFGNGRGLIENGTFLEAADVMPAFAHRRAPPAATARSARIRLLVGTSLDQVAVGPGILLREWKENARRYFEYARAASGAPGRPPWTARGAGLPAFSIHSARFAVARERHDGLAVEVHHHPDHGRNVESIFGCVRQTLERRGRSPPYPDQVLRIVEFPYAGAARVFPDAIAFSEQREFAFDLRASDALCESVAGAIARQHGGTAGVKN